MKSRSMTLPSASLARLEDPEAAAHELLDQGLALCEQWERLGARQFAALAGSDPAALADVQSAQLRLAEQFYQLELRWQEAGQGGLRGRPAGGAAGWGAGLQLKRFQFLAAVQRVFLVNQRNAKALGILFLLGTSCEATAAPDERPTYNRRGCLAPAESLRINTVDCEG